MNTVTTEADRHRLGRPPRLGRLAGALVAVLVISACGSDRSSGSPPAASASSAIVVSTSTTAPSQPAGGLSGETATPSAMALIPQPAVGELKVQPDSARVDLAMPVFTNPTTITNPLFPVSLQESVLLLGQVDDQVFRTEVTLLPDPRVIEWGGQTIPTLVSQYVAFLDGRIHEVAYDFYAQDDAGNVWYFGEDVFNFADGAIVDTHGTWIAGKDGPAAMIMPAHPKVGDVYRPENIPGLVFEEVTVKAVDQTLDGPLGPVLGGLAIEELHMDGVTEEKTFAPGYGEFYTAGGGDLEAMALAVPTDVVPGTLPAELEAIRAGAGAALDAIHAGDWAAASSTAATTGDEWAGYGRGDVSTMVAERMDTAIKALTQATSGKDDAKAAQAAIEVARSSLDLELRHRPTTEVDLARFRLWLEQIRLDTAAKEAGVLYGDFFGLDYTRERFLHQLDAVTTATINLELEELLTAIGDEDRAATVQVAERMLGTLKDVVTAAS